MRKPLPFLTKFAKDPSPREDNLGSIPIGGRIVR